jgi:hypothetical protein
MNAIVLILVVTAIPALAMAAVLIIVIAGIHGDERRMSLTGEPRTRSGIVARRVLGLHSDFHNSVGVPHAGIGGCVDQIDHQVR